MQKYPSMHLNNGFSLCFNSGHLGFKTIKEGKELSVGDQVSFFPCIEIDKYSVSNPEYWFLKGLVFNIYWFSFTPIAKYRINDPYSKSKNINHYLIELFPGFIVFHFNWKKRNYLEIGKLYRGYGRLSTFDGATLDDKAMKNIRCKGIIKEIQPNLIMREDYRKHCSIDENNTTISYDDALKIRGYPKDLLRFGVNVALSGYEKKDIKFQSTGENKNDEMLFYSIKML